MKEIGPSGVEAYFKRRVKEAGGLPEKHVSPGKRGVPDQIVTWSWGVDFVELKAPKGRLSGAQVRDHTRRRELGIKVFVLYTKEMVDAYLKLYGF
jgi:hypothetical protein